MKENIVFAPIGLQAVNIGHQLLIAVQKLGLGDDERRSRARKPFSNQNEKKFSNYNGFDRKRAKLIELQIQGSLRWTLLDVLIPTEAVQLRITLN